MSKLAQLIAKREGFYVEGSLPQRDHNPGDLRHSPHSQHDPVHPDAIGNIATDAEGWADLERQLGLYAARGLTLRQMIVDYYAPNNENDSEGYLAFVCKGLGVTDDCTVTHALELG